MNVFQLIPAKVRAGIYLAYSAAALGVVSIAGGYGATQAPVPSWVVWAGGALVPIGAAFGVTAASNTAPRSE